MKKYTVLVIDDNQINCEILKTLLEPNFDVLVAMDGYTGLETIKKAKIDVILADWFLPGIYGIDLLKEINSLGDFKIAIITGEETIKEEDLLAYNVKRVFYKPLEFSKLTSAVLSLL